MAVLGSDEVERGGCGIGHGSIEAALERVQVAVALLALLFPLALLPPSQRLRGPSRPSVRWPAGRSR